MTRVDTGLLDASRDWAYLTDRQLLLLDDAGFAEALARMTPERVPAQVARTRELLALPSPDVKAMVQRDPLGWFELTSARLQGAAGVLRLDPVAHRRLRHRGRQSAAARRASDAAAVRHDVRARS